MIFGIPYEFLFLWSLIGAIIWAFVMIGKVQLTGFEFLLVTVFAGPVMWAFIIIMTVSSIRDFLSKEKKKRRANGN